MLFMRHETQVGEYYESREETGETVDGSRDKTVARNVRYS